jgi:integrase
MRASLLLGRSQSPDDQRTITVRKPLQRVGGKQQRVELKTNKSRRTIAMPTIVAERLRSHSGRQMLERLAAGDYWQDQRLVFTRKGRTPVVSERLGEAMRPILAAAGLPRQRFHDLRHCAASRLAAPGLSPKVV